MVNSKTLSDVRRVRRGLPVIPRGRPRSRAPPTLTPTLRERVLLMMMSCAWCCCCRQLLLPLLLGSGFWSTRKRQLLRLPMPGCCAVWDAW